MNRVTADSNVYISALIWGGKPLQLLELALTGEIVCGHRPFGFQSPVLVIQG